MARPYAPAGRSPAAGRACIGAWSWHHGPDRQTGVVRPDAPGSGENLHDVQATAAKRGDGGAGCRRPGVSAPVADRYLDRVIVDGPGDLNVGARKRPRMADRVAEELANDENGVSNGAVKDPGRHQVGGQPLPCQRDAGWCMRHEDGARNHHLPRAACRRILLARKNPLRPGFPAAPGRNGGQNWTYPVVAACADRNPVHRSCEAPAPDSPASRAGRYRRSPARAAAPRRRARGPGRQGRR